MSKAIENTGRVVALKQVRAPLRVNRTLLQHEARILQLVQGHPAIPVIYGYGRLKHFEFLAMELLGPSIREKWPGSLASIPLKTVISVVQQTVRSSYAGNKQMLTLIHEPAFRPRTHS